MQLLSFATTFVALWSCTRSLRNVQFVLKVPARRTECFYEQTTLDDTQMDIQLQVIRGGDLDIGLSIYHSNEDKVLSTQVTGDSEPLTLTLPRSIVDYKICLENSFSLLAEKVVYFVIMVYQLKDYDEGTLDPDGSSESRSNLSQLLLKSVDHRLARVTRHLINVTLTQNYFRAREARERQRADSHNRRVLLWSTLELVVILFASLVQVIAIRSMFRTNRT